MKRFITLNIVICNWLCRKYPKFFGDYKNNYRKDLITRIEKIITLNPKSKILEVGGIDRPLLKKTSYYEYVGLDIEKNEKCNELYDQFLFQSIENKIDDKFNLIFSLTLLEHVKNNKKSLRNIYNALEKNGQTIHYVPSKNHYYALILRLVGPNLQKFLLKKLRPNSKSNGYPAYFNLCSYRELIGEMNKIGFKNIKIKVFYKATDYFSFFVPLFLIIAILENIAELFGIKLLASGLLFSARK